MLFSTSTTTSAEETCSSPAGMQRQSRSVSFPSEAFSFGSKFTPPTFPVCPKARVKPGCGRLVAYSSGPVNPHGVTAVTSGRRCALALWFTKEKLYRDMVSVPTRSHSGDLFLGGGGGLLCCSHLLHDAVTSVAGVSNRTLMQMWWFSSHAVAFIFPSRPGQISSFVSRPFRLNKI